MKRIIFAAFASLLVTSSLAQQRFAGGDISLLPTYEEHNANYFSYDGAPISNLLAFCKDEGMNAMRVRLFVNPENAPASAVGEGVRQDLAYVTALSRRIKAQGMKLMLDFHYSDTWADPSKQWTPKAWLGLDDDALRQKIYDYTTEVLQTLKDNDATPDFIQTGNEISYGMLWGPDGTNDNRCYMGSEAGWGRFTALLKAAGKACREQCPEAKIVIHTERISQPDVLKNFYDKMSVAGLDYDIIGLSYYPDYHGFLPALNNALTILEGRYPDKQIMICELGYSYHYSMKGEYDYSETYPLSDAGQQALTRDVIATLRNHEKVTGVFWWFMEANEYGLDWATNRVLDHWWNASLFDNDTGHATSALSTLRTFVGEEAGIHPIAQDEHAETLFRLDGTMATNNTKGVVIAENKRSKLKIKN